MGVIDASIPGSRGHLVSADCCMPWRKTSAEFDDPHLVSHAGLVPVMALAERAGLGDLVAEHVRPAGECGVNAHLKVPCPGRGHGGGRGQHR